MRASSFILLALACSTASTARSPEVLRVGGAPAVAAADLRRCEKVGDVEGVGVGGWGTMRDQQQYWARRDAVNQAEARGATHVEVVWERDDLDYLSVNGVAYRCAAPAR